jgi:hypothetical protein
VGPELTAYKTFMESCYGKRPFISQRGYVGLCPAKAELGDVLCALAGMNGLMVLRPENNNAVSNRKSDDQLHYQRLNLVGDAYAFGLMDAELQNMGSPVQRTTFEIL